MKTAIFPLPQLPITEMKTAIFPLPLTRTTREVKTAYLNVIVGHWALVTITDALFHVPKNHARKGYGFLFFRNRLM